ncbi:MAG: hypothetical protein KDD35_00405, partial [Bdellovibrionales bacterium]|nr:hypothetical protein [Bdellovibrionales bacterium]
NLKLNQKDKKKFVLAVIERYRLTLASLLQNQAKMALAIMPQAENFIQAGLNPDPLLITQARAYYQNKDYEKAIEAYSQIPQSSDYWLTAREERAHTQGRLGQYEKAIADFTTLFSPVFQDSIHPEVYFTASLTYLRLCQYSKVVALLNEFKKKMKIRVSQLTELKDGKSDALAMKAVDSLKNKEYNLVSYAQWASSLPRAFHQDFIIRDQIVKFPSSQLSPKIKARLSQLAQQDLDDIKTVLTKLQLVDAEVMQRIHLAEQVKNNRRQSMGTFNAGKDQLYFPFNGEVWIDELDAYQVQSKSCPNQGGGA